jgi:hypothetical protein
MSKLFSDVELAQRQHIRRVFNGVDGKALVKLSAANGPFSDLAKGRPSSIYPLPLVASVRSSETFLEFGPVFDPDRMGGQFDNLSGMVLWSSSKNCQPFVELAKLHGYKKALCRSADVGSFIDLCENRDNTDLIQLAMQMVMSLVSAFEITSQETSVDARASMNRSKKIRPGKLETRSSSI